MPRSRRVGGALPKRGNEATRHGSGGRKGQQGSAHGSRVIKNAPSKTQLYAFTRSSLYLTVDQPYIVFCSAPPKLASGEGADCLPKHFYFFQYCLLIARFLLSEVLYNLAEATTVKHRKTGRGMFLSVYGVHDKAKNTVIFYSL